MLKAITSLQEEYAAAQRQRGRVLEKRPLPGTLQHDELMRMDGYISALDLALKLFDPNQIHKIGEMPY